MVCGCGPISSRPTRYGIVHDPTVLSGQRVAGGAWAGSQTALYQVSTMALSNRDVENGTRDFGDCCCSRACIGLCASGRDYPDKRHTALRLLG